MKLVISSIICAFLDNFLKYIPYKFIEKYMIGIVEQIVKVNEGEILIKYAADITTCVVHFKPYN